MSSRPGRVSVRCSSREIERAREKERGERKGWIGGEERREGDRNEKELTRWPRGGVHCGRDGVLGTEYRESSSRLLGGRWRNELGEEVDEE